MNSKQTLTKQALIAKKKFLRIFPDGFNDPKYINWERNYKWQAHLSWNEYLNKGTYSEFLAKRQYFKIAKLAANIEAKTNLLFSFEKMALRDAIKSPMGAKLFAIGLYEYLYGEHSLHERFQSYIEVISKLPRKQTRVLTWPLVTVFGFIAAPKQHIFLKPQVTKVAAKNYGFNFEYTSKPNWDTYVSIKRFATAIKTDVADLKPRDFIDIQSYIWVMGSDEYS